MSMTKPVAWPNSSTVSILSRQPSDRAGAGATLAHGRARFKPAVGVGGAAVK